MASIINRPNGHRWIQFKHLDKRHTIRLGKASKFAADQMKHHIETIQQSAEWAEAIPAKTAAYLSDLSADWHEKLSRTGLLTGHSSTLGQLVDRVADEYLTNAQTTQRWMEMVTRRLVAHFGRDHRLEQIDQIDATGFRKWLEHEQGLAPVTTDETCRKARTVFNYAIKLGWLDSNPFHGMKNWRQTNRDRQHFVTMETFHDVIRGRSPVTQAILALGRIAGMRLPSEAAVLRWQDVDFEGGRLHIYATKFAHLGDQKAWRVCPLFPELEPFLRALPRVSELVIPDAQDRSFYSRIKRACLTNRVTPWPRLLHNCRSSRATELIEQGYPPHVLDQWLGHSQAVREKHYAQTLESHFDRATRSKTRSVANDLVHQTSGN